MARISYLTDEHIPNAVAKGLRARGVEAFTLAEKAQFGSSDASLLAFAAAEGRVLITADPDHLRLHAVGVSTQESYSRHRMLPSEQSSAPRC